MKKNLLGLVAIPLIAIGGLTYADDAFLQKEPVNEYIKYSYDTDDGKNIPVITVYGTGIDGKMYGVTIKATNEGTTTAGTGNESYGYYFQWGNNHGNNGTSETTGNLLPTDDLVNWANKGYSGTETRFIQRYNANYDYWSGLDNYNETGAIQHSLWGGSGDNETIDGVVKGYNTGTHQVTNLAGRQGPCESGYHVPSAGEWQELVKLYAKANGYKLNTQTNEYAWSNAISQGTAFSNDLLLPLAGSRYYYDGKVYSTGINAYYWSSSPRGGSSPNYAWILNFFSSNVSPSRSSSRATGQSVRCFKNSYVEPPQTLTFFTVTVDVSPAEGGSASSGSIEAVSGSSIIGTIEAGTGFIKSGDVVLSTVTPNPGYIFSGWTTDCGETLTANCTFTGEFKEILYKVEFTGNSVSTGKVEVTSGTTVSLTGNDIASSDSKDGYLFVGWNTDSGANEGLSNITVTGNIILYSIFKPITYTVHYDANEGTGTMTDSGYTYDLSGNLAENTFTKTGYVFSGWMYNNEIYTGNQEIKNLTGINGATITMVTQWKPITYSVEFTGTDVSGTMANQNFTYDVAQNLTGNAFTKTGYTFSGWINGTTGYTDGQEVSNLTTTDGDTVTLTAQWTANTYTVKFDAGEGNGTMDDQEFIYDVAQDLTGNKFTRDGYTFSGWTDGINVYTDKQNVNNLTGTNGATITLTAQWIQNTPSGDSSSAGGSSGGGGSRKASSTNDSSKSTDSQTGNETDSSTNASNSEENTQDSAKASEGQNQGKTYSDEMKKAYEFAYKHGITTMDSIEKADMEGPLTRIAMAKMLSQYAMNVLGQKPANIIVPKFKDVSDELDAQYDYGVSLAYQLGIMGINMKNNRFRPNDLVTRGEFATALSRMLYKITDGTDKYYSTHLAKLMEEKIITNDDPMMKELRGYVMIMLMRSAEDKNTEN